MKQHTAIIFFATVSVIGANADEECIFDQKAQKEAYLELEDKYEGSRYIERESKLIIPSNGNEITLRRGGCVHFGITVELKILRTDAYEDEARFFRKIVELVSAYGRELMDPKALKVQIDGKKWHKANVKKGGLYLLQYEGLTSVEIYRNHEDKHTILGISYYI
jgi:hypothetical protein